MCLDRHEEQEKNTKKSSSSLDNSVLVCSDTLSAGISLINSLSYLAQNSPDSTKKSLKIPLVCCVLLARSDKKLADSLSNILVNLLTGDTFLPPAEGCRVVVCEALASLGGSKTGVMSAHIPALFKLLESLTKPDCPKSDDNTRLISVVCSVLFQAYLGYAWDKKDLERVKEASKRTDHWTCYRIGRQAARYGHHQAAYSIYNSLRNKTCTDQQHYWMTALAQVSMGEACTVSSPDQLTEAKIVTDVVDDRATPLTSAANCLYSALSNFKACSSGLHPLEFVQKYTGLRASALSCHSQLVTTCQSMRTSPPPAIAASHAYRDEMVKCCRLVQQLNKLSSDFTELAQQYGNLYQSQFDADPQTLSNISMLQQGAKVMTRAISVLTNPMAEHQFQTSTVSSKNLANNHSLLKQSGHNTVQEQLMMKALNKANAAISELEQLCLEKKPIAECQLLLLTRISEMVTGLPLPYPRLFYQSLQHTQIKLNVTPQPRTPGDPITLQVSFYTFYIH